MKGLSGLCRVALSKRWGRGFRCTHPSSPSPRPLLVCFPLTFTAGADLGSTWHSDCYFRTFLPRPPMGSHGLGQWVFRAPSRSRRDLPQAEGQPPRSRLLHSIRVEIYADVSEIRMCRFRRPLQGTSRDLANELERIRRSHPRRSPSPPSQLESLQSSSCFPRRRSSLTVRCGE